MILREYLHEQDFEKIKNWVTEERAHAMWCANLFAYPLKKENVAEVLSCAVEKFGDVPYIAALEDGREAGFFCFSVNQETNEAMLKFVVVNPEYRGKGIAMQMLELIVKKAFDEEGVDAVQLNVFPENPRAKKCYQKAGFTERKTTEKAFAYKEESWGRCNMVLYKDCHIGKVQPGDEKKIQIIFPGVGYHCDKPLLYYGRDIAFEAGYEQYINVSYSCPVDRIRGDEAKMKIAFEAMYAQAEEQLKDISWEEYTDILFVSKSIGTVIAATYDRKYFGGKVKHLFYTPLEHTFKALEGVEEIDAMAFIGAKDPWSDVPAVIELAKKMNVPIHLYDGLNHSLESDDTESNIRILADVMARSKNFLQ